MAATYRDRLLLEEAQLHRAESEIKQWEGRYAGSRRRSNASGY